MCVQVIPKFNIGHKKNGIHPVEQFQSIFKGDKWKNLKYN